MRRVVFVIVAIISSTVAVSFWGVGGLAIAIFALLMLDDVFQISDRKKS